MRRYAAAIVPAVLGLVLSFAQVRCSGAPEDLRLRALWAVLRNRGDTNDPAPSIAAARALAADRTARIYDPARTVGSAFIYPPLAAAPYRPLAHLDRAHADAWLEVVNRLLLAGIFILVLAVATRGRDVRLSEVAAWGVATLVFYPLMRAVELNQATVLVTLLLGAAWVALAGGRAAAAGVALALAIAVKPHYVLMLPLLFFHARRAVVAALLAGAVLLAVSILYAGVDNHLEYLTRVIPTLSDGYAFYPNHSWNGLMNRLIHPEARIDQFAMAAPDAAVRTLATLAAVVTYAAGLGLALRWRRREIEPTWLLGFAWLVATLVSPISWEHHHAPALFVFASFYASWRAGWRPPAWLLALVSAAFALIGGYFEVRGLAGAGPRLLVSYVFAGALLLFTATSLAIDRRARAAPGALW